NRGHDALRRQVARGIIVLANDQDARMSPTCFEDKQMQFFVVVIVGRQASTPFVDREGELCRVRATQETCTYGSFHIVPGFLDEATREAGRLVLVDINPHEPSRVRSSGDRTRYLPPCL